MCSLSPYCRCFILNFINKIRIVMKLYKYILCLAVAVAPCLVHAQKLSTFEQCREAALKNNLKLRNSQLEVSIARHGRKEAFAGYFPQVSAGGGVFHGFDHLLRADVELPVGSMPLSLVRNGAVASVVAVQPVFAGMRIYSANRLAAVQQDVAQLQGLMAEDEVVQKTSDYFWQIVSLQGQLSTLQTVDRQLEEVWKQVDVSVRAGVATRNDLLRVELRRQELAGNMLKVENGIRMAEMVLAQHIGVSRDSVDVDGGDFYEPEAPDKYMVEPGVAALQRNEYRLSQAGVEAGRRQVDMERGKHLPSVSVGIGDFYYNVTDKNVNNCVVFATVSVPLSSWWGGSHAIKKARLQYEQARNSLQEAEEMLAIDVEKTWNELHEAYEQIGIARKSVASAAENMRLNRDYFNAGTTSLAELLDAESLYTESCGRLTSVCADYQRKLCSYLLKTR